MYLYLLLAVAAVFCAARAIGAGRLLTAALWLAGTSALTSALLYMLGAHEVAVIELSVGAGLVTILFVFAISIAGEEGMQERSSLPRWLAWTFIGLAVLILGTQILPLTGGGTAFELPFALVLWEQRGLDVLLQAFIILAGVVSALGLLSESRGTHSSAADKESTADEVAVSGEVH